MKSISEFAINFKYAFHPRKPRLVLRLVKAVLRSAALRRTALRYVDFSLDFACNLRCKHCFATAIERPGRPTMTVADYRRVARECMDLGAVNFSFQGGEPLLYRELGSVISACRPDRNVISVTTNGTLLSEKKVAELKAMGVDILTVSLDSAIAHEHDRFRGVKGTFDRTLAGIHRALREGLRVTLGTVVTHGTLRGEGIGKLADLARDLRVVLYFILPVPAGRWTGKDDMLLDDGDLEFIDGLTRSSPYLRTDFQANLGPYGCGAAKEILYLTPYGDVLPCPFLHITFGNVLRDPVRAIRDRMLEIPWFSAYHQKCLASTDRDFIDKHLSRTFGAPELPLPWEEAFSSAVPVEEKALEGRP